MKTIAIIFSRSLIVFFILLFGYNLVFIGWSAMEPMKMVLIPALTISAVLLLIHSVISRIAGVRDNFLAEQSLEINSNVNPEELAQKINQQLNWRQVKKDVNDIEFISSLSLKSLGEKISISKKEGRIVVASKPLLSATIFDFGKNFQNLNLVKSFL